MEPEISQYWSLHPFKALIMLKLLPKKLQKNNEQFLRKIEKDRLWAILEPLGPILGQTRIFSKYGGMSI